MTARAESAGEWDQDPRVRQTSGGGSKAGGREKTDADYEPDDPVVGAADALVNDGIVMVCSAGNRGQDGSATLTTEATNPNVITVAAASSSGSAES